MTGVYRISPAERADLLDLARRAMKAATRKMPADTVALRVPATTALLEKGGAFVTLRKSGTLRGCIGVMEARKMLWQAVRDSAWSSAREDQRFLPVTEDECDGIGIEISVLSPMSEILSIEEFIPVQHGIVIEKKLPGDPHLRRGVFLPKVAEEMSWGRAETLSALCKKAGLPVNAWQLPGARFWIFTAEVFGEGE